MTPTHDPTPDRYNSCSIVRDELVGEFQEKTTEIVPRQIEMVREI
jgi:hypothetical protein